MHEHLNKREYLREKRKREQRRRVVFLILAFSGAALVIVLAIVLPRLLTGNKHQAGTDGFSVGDPAAPVSVVEFSNYGCSHCRTFSEQMEDPFFAEYVETGDVYFTYVNLAGNSESSIAAAEASYCAAAQNRFYDYKDYLFTAASIQNGYRTDKLISYASSAGLDRDQFEACLASDQYADAYVQDTEYAQSVGLTGTPSFLINGSKIVYSSDLIPTVDSLLGK